VKATGFSWAANSWGECNTSRPYTAADADSTWFVGVNTGGHAANYSGAQCKYIELFSAWGAGAYYVPAYTPVDWNKACALDAAGMRFHLYFRSPDGTYWCVLG
jgi:hypothetical protein